MVKKYFHNLEMQINLFDNLVSNYSVSTKYYNKNKGFISGRIEFKDNSILNFKEVKDTEYHKKDKYSYQYMDFNKNLIFRYDNAYHHPEIQTFPHHKHLPDNITSTNEPELIDILFEIQLFNNK